MQLLANSLTRDEVQKYLVRTEKKITQLEGELVLCPASASRCRAFLHRELADAYTIADELRVTEPADLVADLGRFGNLGVARGGKS